MSAVSRARGDGGLSTVGDALRLDRRDGGAADGDRMRDPSKAADMD